MKKNLIKKLVLKKLTVASLDSEKLSTLRGGLAAVTDQYCGDTDDCVGGNSIAQRCGWVLSMGNGATCNYAC